MTLLVRRWGEHKNELMILVVLLCWVCWYHSVATYDGGSGCVCARMYVFVVKVGGADDDLVQYRVLIQRGIAGGSTDQDIVLILRGLKYSCMEKAMPGEQK